MYGDQVFLVMHHRLALVTLNLGQLAQEVLLIGKKKLWKLYYIPNLVQKITSNIHDRKKKIKKITNNILGRGKKIKN
jgi:hypothetical protein